LCRLHARRPYAPGGVHVSQHGIYPLTRKLGFTLPKESSSPIGVDITGERPIAGRPIIVGHAVMARRKTRPSAQNDGHRAGSRGPAGDAARATILDRLDLEVEIFVWAVRTILVQKADLPQLENPPMYEFVSG
jgi:hypothetical protein